MRRVALVLCLLLTACSSSGPPPPPPPPPPDPPPSQPIDATGPLVLCGSYFCQPDGDAIFLAGVSHGWELQDGDQWEPTPRPLDWPLFLEDLERFRVNYLRLWIAEHTLFDPAKPKAKVPGAPMPWLRTGPGDAVDGLPRFDLTRPNPAYYARLRERVEQLRERGIYASVMLFQGVSLWERALNRQHRLPHWQTLVWNPRNNVQQWPLAEPGWEAHRATSGPIWEAQLAYIRETIRALEGLPNVLVEVANEDRNGSAAWQYQVILETKRIMAEELEHTPWLVGMTFRQGDGTNAELCASPADWYAPALPKFSLAPPMCPGKASFPSDDHFHVYNRNLRYPQRARDLGHAGWEHLFPSAHYFHRRNPEAKRKYEQQVPVAMAVGAVAGRLER